MNKKHIIRYIIWACIIAWTLQGLAVYLSPTHPILTQLLVPLSMFAPLLAVLLSGNTLRDLGWNPHLKKGVLWYLTAWFGPAIIGTLGAALYFALFPGRFDNTGAYLIQVEGDTVVTQLQAAGITISTFTLIQIISALTYAPIVNMIFALGEEVGWRGTMNPLLKLRFGRVRGLLIGGTIWGIWHWPIMLLTGYEYGREYFGAPVLGMLLFIVIATAMGILFDYLYEKTGSIWASALAHGSINAFAGVPILYLNPTYANQLTLGPLLIGIIGGLPMIIVAGIVLLRHEKGDAGNVATSQE